MLVNEKGDIYGTVGGGTVEYTVIQEAENFLRENTRGRPFRAPGVQPL